MKIGIVIGTNEPEVVWNAFRFGIRALATNHAVNVFLMNSGVELEEIRDPRFDIQEQVNQFIQKNGEILACGTCQKSRHKEGTAACPLHTMDDLVKIVEESDKILTFG
ncbi:DsrE family protein [uncultured Methanoregula sp.]|uniref:DsrE family protein n=1 Tax=uncultured Methanoregula sp. TaxID=1005933 RepID=UPI002AAACF7B|nr:DsrE family protein [uncultured Methanoregula sp.]